jgi:integrase
MRTHQAASSPSIHTAKHLNCPACAGYLARAQAAPVRPSMTFAEAAPVWLAERGDAIAPKTRSDYEYYIRVLCRFFGELRLDQIHAGNFEAYAEERAASAGASCINHELNTVKQVLSRAGCWTEIGKLYRPLKVGKPKVGQAMEPADEERLFTMASTEPRWRVAYLCSILTATTTAGPSEITHLHVNDVELGDGQATSAPMGTLRIRDGLKNGHRERIVPLNATSQWAAGQLLKRYFKICRRAKIEPNPEHFLLPGRTRATPYDPEKPMGSWKKAWRSLRARAGMPTLRMYDLRHHAITKLMEAPRSASRRSRRWRAMPSARG